MPLILSGNIAEELKTCSEKLKALEERRKCLEKEIVDVDKEIAHSKAYYGQLRNRFTLISILPSEILVTIFHICRQLHSDSKKRPFEIIASHVSQEWRTICHSTPLLWSKININLGFDARQRTENRQIAKLRHYLTWSVSCPFALYLKVHGNHNVGNFLREIEAHIVRCQSLSIRVLHHQLGGNHDTAVQLEQIKASLIFASPLSLCELSISVDTSVKWSHDSFDFTGNTAAFTGGAPNLRFARLYGIAGCMFPPLFHLTTFDFDGLEMKNVSVTQYLVLLNSMPQIEHLSLRCIALDRGIILSPVDLPNLKTLRIQPCEEDPVLELILAALPTSQLHTLILKDVDILPNHDFSSVKTFVVYGCSISDEEFPVIVSAFAEITSFQSDSYAPWLSTILGRTSGDQVTSFSRLETLSVAHLEPSNAIDFLIMVRARIQSLGPTVFKQINLDRRSRDVLRNKGYLNSLGEIVSLGRIEDEPAWPTGTGYADVADGFWY